jgi:GR25 family glycosyltransferase involved in LPS biosynthesis
MNFSGNKVTIRAFVINVDSRTDRLANIDAQRDKFAFTLERFSAVTPANLDLQDSRFVSPPVAACWNSHVSLFNKMVEEGVDIAIVFEDDFDLGSINLEKSIEFMISNHVDILQLGFLRGTIGRQIDLCGRNFLHLVLFVLMKLYKLVPVLRKIREIQLLNDMRFDSFGYVPYDFRFGTHGYIITSEAAEKIRGLNNPQFLAADDFFVALSKMKHFNMARFLFSKVSQIKSPSSIR